MNFKEILAFDAEHVFLNPSEFAETMVVDGEKISAMWGQESVPAPDELGATVDAWGVNTESAVLLVAEASLPLPVPGQNITVDGKVWSVNKASPQNGILRLELYRNTA